MADAVQKWCNVDIHSAYTEQCKMESCGSAIVGALAHGLPEPETRVRFLTSAKARYPTYTWFPALRLRSPYP